SCYTCLMVFYCARLIDSYFDLETRTHLRFLDQLTEFPNIKLALWNKKWEREDPFKLFQQLMSKAIVNCSSRNSTHSFSYCSVYYSYTHPSSLLIYLEDNS